MTEWVWLPLIVLIAVLWIAWLAHEWDAGTEVGLRHRGDRFPRWVRRKLYGTDEDEPS